ncbi:MAG: ATP-binding cassette domain-containing protein, partial [Angelakisella sp.]|nr:ATP-binding cassette domain-containing protein [Angelakisella sp.]
MSGQRKKLLELRKLKKYFPVRRGVAIKAVEDVTFSIYEGEKFGVVGESGCGKSTLGRVILQLYPQTSGACIYYGQTRDEMCPQYLAKEVARITDYQRKATEFYQKSLVLQKKADALRVEADALSAMGTDREVKKEARLQKRLSELEFQAHELRKDASRQLREGSRTVGSLILCKDLPKVQELFTQAQKETVAASAAIKKYREYEKQAAEAEVAGKPDPALRDRMEAAKREAVAHRDTAHGLRQKAFDDYRGKDILPITERTQDPAYQDKLDRNYETGINLGKLTREEMRELRREMQMIFQDPAAS